MLDLCIFLSWFRWDYFFSVVKAILWIGIKGLKLKTSLWICFLQTRSFWLHKTLTDGLEWCGLLVDYCDVFISCLDSHSDGTHSLQRMNDTFLQISRRNKLIYILDGLRVSKFSANLNFWVKYSIKNRRWFNLSVVVHILVILMHLTLRE